MPPATLNISLFGEFALVLDGGAPNPGALSRPRVQELMCWLLLQSNGVGSRQVCAASLWPTSDPRQARTNLRREWHALSGVPGSLAGMLDADRQRLSLTLPAGAVVDLRDFDQAVRSLREAVDETSRQTIARHIRRCHAAPLLSGSRAEWLVPERLSRLAAWRAALLLLARSLSASESAEAEACARELLQLDRCDDGARLALMKIQAGTGRRAAAMEGYRRHASRVKLQLGTEPSETLRRYADELVAAPVAPNAVARAAGEPVREEPLWFGRAQETRALRNRVLRERDDPPRASVVVVEGDAGIGKTRLVREALSERWGETILVRCHAAEGELAYRVPAGWLSAPALANELRRLPAYRRASLARAFPDVVDAAGIARVAGESDPRSRALLFDALVDVVVPRSGRRVLLVDDLQWSDQDSLEWLAYLARQPVTASLVIVATLRGEYVPDRPALVECLDALDRHDALHRVSLAPLVPSDARGLIARNASSSAVDVERLVARAGGNPLYLLELLAAIERGEAHDSLPPRINTVISQRFASLDEASRGLLALAAVHERPFDVPLIARLTDTLPEQAADTVDALIERGLLRRADGATFEFVHDCFREAMLASIGPARRRFLHHRTAIALQHRHAAEPDAVVGLVAVHHEHAGDIEEALKSYIRASRVAADAFAYLESIGLCTRALALLPLDAVVRRIDVLDRQASSVMTHYGFASPAAGVICAEIETLLNQLGDVPEALVGYELLRRYHSFAGTPRLAREFARRQWKIARQVGTAFERVRATRSLAFTHYQAGHYAIAHRALSSVSADLATFSGSDDPGERWLGLMCRATMANYLAVRGRANAARTAFDGCCSSATFDAIEPSSRLYPMIGLAFASLALDDDERLARVATMAARLVRACPIGRIELFADLIEGYRQARAGETAVGIARLERAMTRYEAIEDRHFTPMFNLLLGRAQLLGEHHEAAEGAARRGLVAACSSGDAYCTAELQRLLALALARGRSDARTVDDAFDRAIDTARRQGARTFLLRALHQAAVETLRRPVVEGRAIRLAVVGDALERESRALAKFGVFREIELARRVSDELSSRAY